MVVCGGVLLFLCCCRGSGGSAVVLVQLPKLVELWLVCCVGGSLGVLVVIFCGSGCVGVGGGAVWWR